tara:strand:- start:5023 stop:5574 length:552 start_codon:yes stop_codon:yes gene_type:complete
MGRYGETKVEMQKIINMVPIDTLWVYWETDIYYTIVGSVSQIMIRTHDTSLLTNSEAKLIDSHESIDIPIGTYSIGTYSVPSEEYKLIVGTVGYITDVHRGTYSVGSYIQSKIPNDAEVKIEWEAMVNQLTPYTNPIRPGGCGVGATYSILTRRDDNIGLYWLTDEYGNTLIDIDDGNILTYI